MPTKPTTEVRSANSQRDNRWLETVYDQHKSARFPRGRPLWGHLEMPTNPKMAPGFCTELMPGDHSDPFNSSWSAPWLPAQQSDWTGRSTMRLDMKRMTLTWLYGTVIADDTAALQRYYDAAAKIAYTKGWPVAAFGEQVPYQITSILGDAPRSPKIAEAALAGDPWILGHTEQVNEELAALLKGVRPHAVGQSHVASQAASMAPAVPLVSTAQVLATDDIQKLIADAIAAHEQAKVATRMAKARGGKGKNGQKQVAAA